MEWNRLSNFTSEEDWRNAKLLSKLHNVNVSDKSHLLSPKDFMPTPIDEIIEDEIAKEEAKNGDPKDVREAAIYNFNQHVRNLKAIGKPVQTIKVD